MSELQAALETSIFVDIALPTEERRHQAKVVATLKEAARLVANPNILAAARSRYSEAVRFTFTQKQWDEIMEETRQIVAAALTPPEDK